MTLPRLLQHPATRIALAYLLVGVVWILASDRLLEWVIGERAAGAMAQTFKGLLFVAFTSLLLYALLTRQPPPRAERRAVAIEAPRIWMPLATYALLSLGLIFIGLNAFHVQRDQLRVSAEAQLRAVGESRVEQVVAWLRGVEANAGHFAHDSRLAEDFAAWLGGDGREETRLRHHLADIRARYGYANITLFDSGGRPRLSERRDPHMAEHRDDALRAIAMRRPLLVDYHRHGDQPGEPMLGMVAPMILGHGADARAVGALFFSIPARTSVIPLISRWPGASASGETVLARRELGGIRLLYASRQGGDGPNAAYFGQLVDNASARWLLANAAVASPRRIPDAVDFRRNPVLAYGAAIPGTPWLLIAKQDKAEVDALVERLAWLTALVTLLLSAAAGLALWLWWHSQANRQRAQLLGKELERQLLERRYEMLSRHAGDVILLADDDDVILEINERVAEMHGYPREELLGLSLRMLWPPDAADAFAERRAALLAAGRLRFEDEHQRQDGARFPVEVSAHVLELHGLRHIHMTVRDASERIRIERALQEREALYRGVVETSADGFWICDLEGRLLEVNDAYRRRSGYSREELLSMRIADLDAQKTPEEIERHIETIARTGSDLFETRHRARDGASWQVEVNVSHSPLQGGRLFIFLRDIQRRNRSEALLRTRLQLSDLAARCDLDELMRAALDRAELFSGSRIGFFHFVSADQETLTLQAWSSNTLQAMCTAEGKGRHYPVSQAGVWADAVRRRQSLIHNDYASLPERKGMPEGHATVLRELVVPILRDGMVVAVLGVGNKATDYTPEDVETVEQFAAMVMDLVARKRAEEQVLQANARLIEAQRIARLGDWDYDVLADRITWSEQVYAIVGLDPASGTRGYRDLHRLFHADDLPIFEGAMQQALAGGEVPEFGLRVVRPDGEIRHVWSTGKTASDASGRVTRVFGTIQDITERKQAEARLEQATHFDALTGLPNARWLLKRVQHAMGNAAPDSLALLLLNVDRFSQLNESLGRAVGDRVLVALSRRWAAALPDGCLLTRLDADQFAVLHEHYEDTARVLETAASLLDAMRQPLPAGENDTAVSLTLSIGIALYPGDAEDAGALLHAAEDALRSVKADKGNQARFFDRRHAQAAIAWFETENALRQALAREEFFLDYQPQVEAGSGRTVAVEALLRWRHAGETVPPGRFINVVEGTDLAEPVSRWVLRAACRQARLWLDRGRPLRVAVNIFSDHVTSGHLLDDVRQALEESGLPPQWLELEVVESSLLKNPEAASLALRAIKRLGVGLALDDFGTGYSSLGYLKHYPFDVLKIDQIFARNVNRDPEDAAIVRSTITLAHNLRMRVLAEGVETEPQLRFMLRYGCDQIQGYLLSRPTTPQEVETQVMERRDLRPGGLTRPREVRGILVIDDQASEAERLRALLRDEGYRAFVAQDLEGALEVMGREPIDLIVCDHELRETSGVEVLARIRRLFPEVPRVMISSSGEQAVVIDALNRAGIRAFLPRPVDAGLLSGTLRDLLAVAGKDA